MSEKSIKFHIESNDYFGTVATILSLLRQTKNYNDKALVYPINFSLDSKDYGYWKDNFRPQKSGEVVTIWGCGDHGAVTSELDRYFFDAENNIYQHTYQSEEWCGYIVESIH